MMTSCERFLAELKKSSGKNTCGAYERDLRAFSEHFAALGVFSACEIDGDLLREYFDSLSGVCAPSTVNRRISVVRSFYKYLVLSGECETNPAASVSFKTGSAAKKKAKSLSGKMIDVLLSQPDPFDPKGRRDRAMLELCSAGVRVTELVELKLSNLNLNKAALVCDSSKRPRVVSLYPKALKLIEEYLVLSRPRLIKDPGNSW
ncbi:MAG: site-specific integrase, partial [Clostridia bacterium]|nr:site-specific integrase [Clostridia bacterium]